MNIKQAKEQIQNAMKAYFSKDEFGNYIIPIEKQRPVFLMGPPGIGKTAIMEQIAEELHVGLVSYSMTHHTRQSALGLPFIEKKTYGGVEYSVSEYTMSEIIASVYDMIENTGIKEGILFLDEINCVSETLSPAMLQFLQYKIFGRHRVPEGWIVVTAGNPPEYNNSVREFDIVTWDRLKRVDVEADYDAWKEYAYKKGIHPSIITYLDIKKSDFYKIETTVDGKTFVTARGWSDLSDMIKLYEKNDIKVDEKLVLQYLQNGKIAKSFAIYYDLFNKYKSDYQVDKILSGKADESIKERAKKAKFDERLALIGLMLDAITELTHNLFVSEKMLNELMPPLKNIRKLICSDGLGVSSAIENEIKEIQNRIKNGKMSSTMSSDEMHSLYSTASVLEKLSLDSEIVKAESGNAAFEKIRAAFENHKKDFRKQIDNTKKSLSNAFTFCDGAFGEGQETLILVTELTISYYDSAFISNFGCDEYFKHNKELLFHERQIELIKNISNLNLDE